jgi:succinyl-diaminopimelate desuccinylase
MVSPELVKKIEEYAASSRQGLVEDLKTLVRIPSVSHYGADGKPFGAGCAKVLDAALSMAQGYGLETKNCDYWYGLAGYGQGDKTIGLFAHLDVVPEGNNWIHSPYDPVEKDGALIGRGVADNKNAAVVSFYVLRAFRELGLPLRSRLSIFLGCSEETGMQDIDRFVEEQPMPDFSIVPDISFPVCHGEKGIFSCFARCKTPWTQIISLTGGSVENMVPDTAQAVLPMDTALLAELRLTAEKAEGVSVEAREGQILVTAAGRSAHAAYPYEGVSALLRLLRFLASVPAIHQGDREICAFAASTMADWNGQGLGIAHEDAPSGKLTCISGVASTQEGCLELHYNIRYPVTHKGALIREGLEKAFSQAGWNIVSLSDNGPMYIPADDPKVQELSRIYHEVTGRDGTPYVAGGGTYARHLKNAIGFGMESPWESGLPQGHGGVHEPDEAVSIDALVEALKIYILSVLEIDALLHS